MVTVVVVLALVVVLVAAAWARVASNRSERQSVRNYERALDRLGDAARRSDAMAEIHPPAAEDVGRPHVRPAFHDPVLPARAPAQSLGGPGARPVPRIRIVPPAPHRAGMIPVFDDLAARGAASPRARVGEEVPRAEDETSVLDLGTMRTSRLSSPPDGVLYGPPAPDDPSGSSLGAAGVGPVSPGRSPGRFATPFAASGPGQPREVASLSFDADPLTEALPVVAPGSPAARGGEVHERDRLGRPLEPARGGQAPSASRSEVFDAELAFPTAAFPTDGFPTAAFPTDGFPTDGFPAGQETVLGRRDGTLELAGDPEVTRTHEVASVHEVARVHEVTRTHEVTRALRTTSALDPAGIAAANGSAGRGVDGDADDDWAPPGARRIAGGKANRTGAGTPGEGGQAAGAGGRDLLLRRAATSAAAAVTIAALAVGVVELSAHSSGKGTPAGAPSPSVTSKSTGAGPTGAAGTKRPGAKTGKAKPAASRSKATGPSATSPSTTIPNGASGTIQPVSTSSTLVAYSAPSGSYTLSFTASSAGALWVGVQQSVNGPYAWMQTLQPGQSATYKASGPVVVRVGAPPVATVQLDGSTVVFPKSNVQPFDMTFTPSSGAPSGAARSA